MENIYKIVVLESNKRKRLFDSRENLGERVVRDKRPATYRKCFFGKSDPEDTKRMLHEQYLVDQQRFLDRFGFDIETIEHLERTKDDVKENIENDRNEQNKAEVAGRKILKAKRKVSFNKAQDNLSQQFITDFYQARKNQNQEKKSLQQANMNIIEKI